MIEGYVPQVDREQVSLRVVRRQGSLGAAWRGTVLPRLLGQEDCRRGNRRADVVATEVIEPWGGGKWHHEVFRATAAEPEDWNGEM